MAEYLPEGCLLRTTENQNCLRSYFTLQECQNNGRIVEAPCIICDSKHNLIVDLGCMRGVIPREEGAIGISEGTTKDIALISRVNKPVCFKVTGFKRDENDNIYAVLSRKSAQQECFDNYLSNLIPGDVITARVTHLEQFGSFVDIGCGLPSLLPIDLISVSRISHPADRFYIGQNIYAAVKSVEDNRICLTHKELLGTWEQNAARFEQGETVTGIVRSIEDYGIFVELAPNLAGLAEPRKDVFVNSHASVYIKAIIPEKMKIKLIIVNSSNNTFTDNELDYFITSGHLNSWTYSSSCSDKTVKTVFTGDF